MFITILSLTSYHSTDYKRNKNFEKINKLFSIRY